MIWKKRIYADAAAATPLSARAKRELIRLIGVYGNPSALHFEATAAKAELEKAREKVAAAIGAHADEIVFTSGGTEANNFALAGVLRPLLHQNKKTHAVTSAIEHSSVLEPLRALQKEGLQLTELPVNSSGVISIKELAEALAPETALVSVQYINSEIGTVQPIRDIAKAIRHFRKMSGGLTSGCSEVKPPDIYFHCDASQAPLWKKLNVEQLGVDLLTLDGQKMLGPKGVGVLFVRRGVRIQEQMHGGGQERGLRSGTENVPLAGAFAVALEDAQKDENKNAKRTARVRNSLLSEILKYVPDAALNGAVGDERVANNLNISIPRLDGQMAVIALNAQGVAASTRSACDTSIEAPSHVLVALGLARERAQTAIRLTLLPSATTSDAKHIARALAEVARKYKNMA